MSENIIEICHKQYSSLIARYADFLESIPLLV